MYVGKAVSCAHLTESLMELKKTNKIKLVLNLFFFFFLLY